MLGNPSSSPGRRRHVRWRRRVATGAAVAGLVSASLTLSASGAHNQPRLWQPVATQVTPSVPGRASTPAARVAVPTSSRHAVPAAPFKAAAPVWPAGSGTAALTTAASASAATARSTPSAAGAKPAARAGTLPVSVASADASAGAATSVSVAFSPRQAVAAAGVNGVVFTVGRSDGGTSASAVDLSLDYTGFAAATGGGYADRLTLVRLPACALTTPTVPACRTRTPVPAANDTVTGVLSARLAVSATPMVLAATTTAAGGVGTYAATSLSPEGSWSSGGNTGAFTFDYPVTVPPSTGGAAPEVSLSYNSSSVDGRTSATNAQASWIGDGWDYSPGFIERSYQPCKQDGITNSSDLCWGGNQLQLSLRGASGTLVRDDTSGAWHLESDIGAKIVALTGVGNGAWQGEAWEVITTDGSRYYFGQDYLPGGAGTDAATDSVWTQPVYCPKSGDGPPSASCYDSSKGTGSVVTNMAWRWNLDYAVDPHGNLQTYSWTPETDYYEMGYDQGNGTGKLTQYDRGGYLASIGYGYSLSAAIAGAKPTETVTFGVTERCLTSATFTNCDASNLSSGTASNWPDVPFDQICTSSSTSCTNDAPTYFSTKRLTTISTAVLVGSSYQPVDTYTLSQSFPAPEAGLVPAGKSVSATNPGDGTVAVMWLDSIQHTGADTLGGGASTTLPPLVFTADEMPNRVDGNTTGSAALYRPRMIEITTEAGAQTVIAYSAPQCSRTNNVMPSSPDSDTMNCYPQYWTPNGATEPVLDWFNTFQTTSVSVNDLVSPQAWSEASQTSYSYAGPAWHRNDSPLTASAQRTWSIFRGFRTVTATMGAASVQSVPTQTVTTFLQGMDGDYLANGTRRSVSVTDTVGDSVTDSNWLYGAQLEKDTLVGVGGQTLSKLVGGPWTYTQTASQAQANSMPALVARMTKTSSTRMYQRWHDSSWEETAELTTDNAFGLVASRDVVQTGAGAQPEVCTTTTYATNAAANMANYPDEVLAVQGPCGTTPSAATTQSDQRTFYDGSTTLGSLGSAGDPTSSQEVASYDSTGAPVYVTASSTRFDSYGRTTSSTDADGHTTTTGYTAPAVSPDSVTTTNPMGWTTKTVLDPGRGQPVSATDANGEMTTKTYDGLGRLTAAWSPLHSQAANAPADKTFSYSITGTAPTVVTTSTLRDDGSYGRSTSLLDALMRPIQSQTPTVDGSAGRLIVDTHYNSLGQKVKTTDTYYDKTTAPGTAVFVPANDSVVPAETQTIYDGAGRPVQTLMVAFGVNQYSTTTAYRGMDQSDTTPAAGGTATSTFVDGSGHTSATWSYRTATPTDNAGDAVVISRTYTPTGKLSTVRDAAGNTWTYTYNLLGQGTKTVDPGAGTSSSTYSTGGEVLSRTDGNGNQLSYTYDALGRKTAVYNTTGGAAETPADETGSWTYDTLAKGQLTSSSTYTDGLGDAANTWTESITGYTVQYQSTGETVTVPTSQGALAATYQSTKQYTAETSLLSGVHYFAEGGLPKEQFNYGYTLSGALSSFGSPYAALNSVSYTPQGKVLQTNFGPYGYQLVRTETYDPSTMRMLSGTDSLQTLNGALQAVNYTYNQAGAITAESDQQHGVAVADTQCFTYDQLNELTAAWTDTAGVNSTTGSSTAQIQGVGACVDSAPTAGKVTGGPAPYWQSYSYDALGDRVGETSHDTSVASNTNTVTQTLTYNGYNPSTNANTPAGTPDAVQSVTTSGPSGTTTAGYTYYSNGATKGRPGQSLTYNAQGLTQTVTNTATGSVTSYTYDASGVLLLQSDPAASQNVLYLPWGEQITLSTGTNAVSGQRYVTSPDGVTVVHGSTGGVSYELTNTNGTATATVSASNLAYSLRYYDPFGQARGTAPTAWTDQRAYLNQPGDPTTGLDLLGQRQYDPVLGRFMSVDPLQENGDQRQLNGYSYAADNPVNGSDPKGLMYLADDGYPCPPPPPPPPVVIIATPGTGEGGSLGGTITAFYHELATRYGGYAPVLTPKLNTYPANGLANAGDAVKIWAHVNGTYNHSVATGEAWLTTEIAQVEHQYPGAKIVLAGYSQGAEVTADVYQRLPQNEKSGISAMVLFGDPLYNPTSPGGSTRFIQQSHGALGMRPAYNRGDPVVSVCNFGDVVCGGVIGDYLGFIRFPNLLSVSYSHTHYEGAARSVADSLADQWLPHSADAGLMPSAPLGPQLPAPYGVPDPSPYPGG